MPTPAQQAEGAPSTAGSQLFEGLFCLSDFLRAGLRCVAYVWHLSDGRKLETGADAAACMILSGGKASFQHN